MKASANIWIGYWPSFAMAGVALVLSALGVWHASLLLSALSIAHTFYRSRKNKRGRSAQTRPRLAMADPARARPAFEPFTTCPGCNMPGHHLLSAPRQHMEAGNPWRAAMGDVWSVPTGVSVSVWNKPGVVRWMSVDDEGPFKSEPRWSTVVDRECLSCGKTWVETYAA